MLSPGHVKYFFSPKTVPHATGQHNTEESAIRPLQHIWAQRHPWLAEVTVMNRKERTFFVRMDNFASLGSRLWHCRYSNLWFPVCILVFLMLVGDDRRRKKLPNPAWFHTAEIPQILQNIFFPQDHHVYILYVTWGYFCWSFHRSSIAA